MNLEEHLSQFARVMEESGHASSWGTANGTYQGEPMVLFVFVTHDPNRVKEALRVLGAAGLLCETLLRRDGTTPDTDSDTVQCLVEGLRAIG